MIAFDLIFVANENTTEHEATLQSLDRRWQALYKQIVACERETEKILFLSTFEDELHALTKARIEYQTWIDSHGSSSSTTEIQVRSIIHYRFIRAIFPIHQDDDKTSINIDYMMLFVCFLFSCVVQ